MRRLAVIGHPVAHSRSPAIHNAAFEALGLAGRWRYEAIDVAPAGLAARLGSLEGEGFAGANVTIPHKLAALELADQASPAAAEIGAANTLTFSGGLIRADNTDAGGFLAALPEPPAGKAALVLGAGGGARAVVWALVGGGARVSVWNRTPERAARLAAALGARAASGAECRERQGDYDVIVNATSVGLREPGAPARSRSAMAELNQLPLAADTFSDRQTVVDLVYRDGGTELIRAARERGAAAVDGLEILVQQGAASFRIWTGLEPPIEAMRRAAECPVR